MAVKNNFKNGYSYADIYDTQDALDKGILGSVSVPTTTTETTTEKGGWQNMNRSNTTSSSADELFNNDPNFNKDKAGNGYTFGSILGMTDAINANRKKRTEQDKTAGQGFGLQSSILGGGPF